MYGALFRFCRLLGNPPIQQSLSNFQFEVIVLTVFELESLRFLVALFKRFYLDTDRLYKVLHYKQWFGKRPGR